MQNLQNADDFFKAVSAVLAKAHKDVTALAQLVAIHIASGVTSTRDLARLTGYSERSIQKAKGQLGFANQSSPAPESELQFANYSSGANQGAEAEFGGEPGFGTIVRLEPSRTCARIESPSGILPQLENNNPPQTPPSNVKPVSDWRNAFGVDDHGVDFSNGKVTLFNGVRAGWVERFGGDEDALDLALIEAAGCIQRNSPASLKLQVERKLANIARDKRTREQNYAKAVARNAQNSKPKSSKSYMERY